MQRDAAELQSNNERDFIIQAVKEELRVDGRSLYDWRTIKVQFALDDRSATVQLGTTTVMAAITAELTTPYNDRAREGSVKFNVELSPMASASFQMGKPGEEAVELGRLVERCLRGSGALDLEALCVLPGRKVWSIRVDIHVLDSGGNLIDACCLAALAALLGFRKPQVEVDQSKGEGEAQVTVFSPEVREPQPLTLHHLPFSHTFALFESGAILVSDPTLSEEAASSGRATLFINPHGEICGWQMAEGVGLDQAQMMRCVRLATSRTPELASQLEAALKHHELARVQARVRRQTGTAAAAAAAAAGHGHLPGQQQAAAASSCRGATAAATAAAAAVAAGGVGGRDVRNVTVLTDADMAGEKLQELMAEIQAAVVKQQLRDEELEKAAAAAAAQQKAAAAQVAVQQAEAPAVAAAGAADAAAGQPPSVEEQLQQQFRRPPALAGRGAPGVARLGGNVGSNKRAADGGLDAFLGLNQGGSGAQQGGGAAAGGPRGAAQQQSLGDIEQMLLQAAAPQDLSEAVKPKKKHKKKDGK